MLLFKLQGVGHPVVNEMDFPLLNEQLETHHE